MKKLLILKLNIPYVCWSGRHKLIMKKRKSFILGGGGFIGFAIVKILAQRKSYDLTIADDFHKNQDDRDI